MKTLDNIIAGLERQLQTLRKLRVLLEEDPSVTADVLDLIRQMDSPHSVGKGKPPRRTQLVRLLDYMSDGQWHTVPEMAEAIGANKASIAPYLYRQKGRFESRKYPENPRMRQWRRKNTGDEDSPREP